ncbi:MAG: ABC transporter permease, partial [Acidobacteriota bacterium]
MNEIKKDKENMFWPALKNVFEFFFYLGKKAKKSRIFFLFSFLPVLMACIFRFSRIFSERPGLSGM